jgi:hypothetical protein
MSGCKTCTPSNGEDIEILPSGDNTPEAAATLVTTPTECPPSSISKICTTIKDQCGCCEQEMIPLAKIKSTSAFAMPACNNELEVMFEEDISNLMVGLQLYALDSTGQTIRLKITSINPDHKLTLRNICSSCCSSSKPVGEAIPAGTYFSWGLPECCSSSGSSSSSSDCLIGTFYFPNSGATAAAQVANSNNFVLGGLYSMGGFIWKVSARVTSTQILLENPAPGNGSSPGGFIEGGCDGECIYPITPISEASVCDDAAVTEVALIGCTTSGQRKLTGSDNCGLVKFDSSTGNFSVDHLFGGSSITGPHYIQWDKDNPCNSRLVSAPDLAGSNCSTITEPLFLTPANTSNQYEVTVATTGYFSTTPPSNVVEISGRQFTVTAIVTAGTPGKIRLQPRFTVTASETIAADTNVCQVEGCQAFDASAWPFGCAITDHGERVFCANDGLRTAPAKSSAIGRDFLNYSAVVTGIENVGTYARPMQNIAFVNPSTCHSAVVFGVVEYINDAVLGDDGAWEFQTLFDINSAPVTLQDSIRANSQNGTRRVNVRNSTTFIFSLTPGQTSLMSLVPRLVCTNASADNTLEWLSSIGKVTYHITNT